MDSKYTTDKYHINILAGLCAAYGMRKVVISPGSRNAPLIMAFHHHPDIECFVVPDERSAAYFALGIAQYTQKPVGIICTSGTAALNYTPAMAEAYYQKLPIVAITADRPPEWIDQLDGQTINQAGMYANFTSYQAQLPVEIFSQDEKWHVERIVRDGFLQLRNNRLPIHFNVPLREPLYNKKEQKLTTMKPAVFDPVRPAFFEDLNLITELRKYSKILLIAGMRHPDKQISNIINQIGKRQNIVIMQETLSNLPGKYTFQVSDALLFWVQEKGGEEFKPDLIITFGDILLSKPLKQWVRSLNDASHWIVNTSSLIPDVFQKIDRVVNLDAIDFLHSLVKYDQPDGKTYFNVWDQSYNNLGNAHNEFAEGLKWSDMFALKALSEIIPGNSCVHLGNSSPVRYAQFFNWRDDIQFFSNRGTAGIDGVTSTAIGMASQTNRPVFLITGDVSFFYDSNAFWNNYKRKNFKIIVLNNKGGNIFKLISGPEGTGLLDNYFTTHYNVSIEFLCKAYGIGYYSAKNNKELLSGLEQFLDLPNCAVFEIVTNPEVNTKVWKDYFRTIRMRLDLEQKSTH